MINTPKNSFIDTQFYGMTKGVLTHPFFAGSALMILGSNFANFLAYVYHLVVGRMLGPADYGELVAFISVVSIITVSFNFLGLVIVKFSSSLGEKESSNFLIWLNKRAIIAGILGSVFLIFTSPLIARFLHIHNYIMIFLSPLFFFYLLSFVYRSFLQGKLRFKEVVMSLNLDMGGRMVFGIALISLGLSVTGAVIGNVISTLLAYVVLFYFIKKYLTKSNHADFKHTTEVFRYSIPVIAAAVSSYMFITTDILMVKHYFSAHEAGLYAAISTLGKVIFYGTGPINAVMFPLISKRHSQGQKYNKILIISLILTLGMGVFVTLLYYLLPQLMINILYGGDYLQIAPYLFRMGIFLSIFALANLLLSYFISIEKTKVVYFSVVLSLLQIVLLYFYHDNIVQIINISTGVVTILLAILIIFIKFDINNLRQSTIK